MKNIKKVGILGVGLMGGSLSLALRKKFPGISIWGYARSQKSYDKLKKLKVLNKVERDLQKVVEDADLVVLALPIDVIVDYFGKIASFLKPGAIVFDLGSSKKLIERAAKKLLPKKVTFIGCHPLCGAETSGAQFAKADLYKGTTCIITNLDFCKEVKFIEKLWKKVGSKAVFLDAELHDRILAMFSHFPHIVAFSMIQSIPRDSLAKFVDLTLPSLRDMTRISDSPADVWSDIFLSNKENILGNMVTFRKIMEEFEKSLKAESKEDLIKLIKKANSHRTYLKKGK